MSDMNELNEAGGQKCPTCGKQTMALGELTLIHGPEGIFTLYVRKWQGVDCEHSYLEILADHMTEPGLPPRKGSGE